MHSEGISGEVPAATASQVSQPAQAYQAYSKPHRAALRHRTLAWFPGVSCYVRKNPARGRVPVPETVMSNNTSATQCSRSCSRSKFGAWESAALELIAAAAAAA
jgi:hypothetical protein